MVCKLQPPHTIYERITNCAVFEHVFQHALPYVSCLIVAADASRWVQRSPASSWRIRGLQLLLSCAARILLATSDLLSVASYRRGLLYSWLVVPLHIDCSGFLENKPNPLPCRGS